MSTGVRRALLEALIDDAGLFPPARLPMDEAVARHLAAKSGPDAWLLGRFLCPASRLGEFDAAAGAASITVGVIADLPAPHDSIKATLKHGAEHIEVACAPAEVGGVLDVLPFAMPAYVEPRRGADGAWLTALALIAEAHAAGRDVGAKIRCGGLDAAAFPSEIEVASFVVCCRDAGVPFKATAGLHHPIRQTDPATGIEAHGFLNLLVAAALAMRDHHDVDAVAELLAQRDTGAVLGRVSELDDETVRRLRARMLVSYGSCSLAEPIDDLRGLGLLGGADA
jgi:hypothetical protein